MGFLGVQTRMVVIREKQGNAYDKRLGRTMRVWFNSDFGLPVVFDYVALGF
jgi:hypothetical protein